MRDDGIVESLPSSMSHKTNCRNFLMSHGQLRSEKSSNHKLSSMVCLGITYKLIAPFHIVGGMDSYTDRKGVSTRISQNELNAEEWKKPIAALAPGSAPAMDKFNAIFHEDLSFPWRLYNLLQLQTFDSIVSWVPDGTAFLIINEERFTKEILPRFFPKMSKLKSFKRQLSAYGFSYIRSGVHVGACKCEEKYRRYSSALTSRTNAHHAAVVPSSTSSSTPPSDYHLSFLRGEQDRCHNIERKKAVKSRPQPRSSSGIATEFYGAPFAGKYAVPSSLAAGQLLPVAMSVPSQQDQCQQQKDSRKSKLTCNPEPVTSTAKVWSSPILMGKAASNALSEDTLRQNTAVAQSVNQPMHQDSFIQPEAPLSIDNVVRHSVMVSQGIHRIPHNSLQSSSAACSSANMQSYQQPHFFEGDDLFEGRHFQPVSLTSPSRQSSVGPRSVEHQIDYENTPADQYELLSESVLGSVDFYMEPRTIEEMRMRDLKSQY